MSFCRWSDDDYRCNIYAYESDCGGYCVHVARKKPLFNEPLPPAAKDTAADEWFQRRVKVNQMVREAGWADIGLSRDGESYSLDSLSDVLELLESLKEEGYNVPDYVINTLRDDALSEER